jgi:hypothetical protein
LDEEYGMKNIIPGNSRVVDTVIGRTAEVYKLLPGFGVQVWIKERGYERENWPWHMITVRQPRYLKRYPRPFRWPREEPTKQCHCKIGRMELEDVEQNAVRCTRCKQLIGSESYPRRIERATDLIRKASNAKSRPQVHPRVQRRAKRQARGRGKVSVKARKSPGGLVIRQKRRSNAQSRATKTRKGAALSKSRKKVSPRRKVPTLQKKRRNKVGAAKERGVR